MLNKKNQFNPKNEILQFYLQSNRRRWCRRTSSWTSGIRSTYRTNPWTRCSPTSVQESCWYHSYYIERNQILRGCWSSWRDRHPGQWSDDRVGKTASTSQGNPSLASSGSLCPNHPSTPEKSPDYSETASSKLNRRSMQISVRTRGGVKNYRLLDPNMRDWGGKFDYFLFIPLHSTKLQ